jgi:MoaA/NifB/PqqE/SkfB family radical SAM enzyme
MRLIKQIIFNVIRKQKENFPDLLSIELSNLCNANCIMCPRSDLTRKLQNMDFETLKKVVADCKNKPLKKINLFWMGDSLCNNSSTEYFRYIRKELPKVKLYLSTNAGLLTKNKTEDIINEGLLDVINFDIDGITRETYEKIRRGVSHDEVKKNVLYFIGYKEKVKKNGPQVRVTIIKMKPTENEIDSFVGFWRPLVDKVDVNDYNTWLGTKEDLNLGETFAKSQKGIFDFACIHPWNELVISADGKAGLCCLDYDLKAVIGDVGNETIEQIWKGKKINKYRQKMLKLEYGDIDVCKRCNGFIYQYKKTWAKLQK